jgi:phospholipase C
MVPSRKLLPGAAVVLAVLFLAGCRGLGTTPDSGGAVQLTVTAVGSGTGTVISNPAGISCPGKCSANFTSGTQVALTATPGTSFVFTGWSGACSGQAGCTVTVSSAETATATFSATLQSINHIIFMMQENRSLDHYFGAMKEYWASHGFPPNDFEGLPQFNNPSQPLATNLGCDPAKPFPANDCVTGPTSPAVPSFHMLSQCAENPSPSWNESHVDWNLFIPWSTTPTMDGYVITAGHDARTPPPFNDVDGNRAMGYYDFNDLPYYYYMASTFGTSDQWFSPTMTRTQPNRMYLMAATSLGRAYPLPNTMTQVTAKTIFESLNDKDPSSWRVYVTDDMNVPLGNGTELGMFTFANTHLDHFAPASQFLTDLTSGNLPAVVEIDPGFKKATDEHAGTDPSVPAGRIQTGSAYVASLINALMRSPYWKDSVFILTWDEGGGFYDHVPPHSMVSPDGIKPNDLLPGDICNSSNPANTGPNCDFIYTGYRVPLIVVSPFSKKNFVSHTPADYTAILKLIETRFGLAPLTARDAAQMDMSDPTEFFDFKNAPWMTPPPVSEVPVQPDTMPCYTDHLP